MWDLILESSGRAPYRPRELHLPNIPTDCSSFSNSEHPGGAFNM